MTWTPPTMADELGLPENEMVRCRCKRWIYPDHMVRLPARLAAGDGPEYVCDACRGTLKRRGIQPDELVEHLGAPAHVLEKLRRKWAERPGRVP